MNVLNYNKSIRILDSVRNTHTIQTIKKRYINKYCEIINIPYDVVTGKCRLYEIKIIRFIMMFALRSKGYTLDNIGRAFNREHTTVVNAMKKVNDVLFDKYCQDGNSIKIYEKIKDI